MSSRLVFITPTIFLLIVLLLHGADDDTDEEVEYDKSGNQNKGSEVDPGVWKHFHDRPRYPLRPAFQRHYLEQRVKREPQVAKALRELFREQLRAHDSEDVEHHGEQEQNPANAGNGL